MGHPLRMYEPNVVYEVTVRTIQGRALLRPSEDCNEVFVGLIGRALQLNPDVRLHGVQVLSTHSTWSVSSDDPEQLADFFRFMNGEVSGRIGTRLHDWPGPMWDRRARPIAAVDEAAQIARLEYLLAQGTKEGLVESPCDWPGVNSARALLHDHGELHGTYFHIDQFTKARRRDPSVSKYDFCTRYTVKLDKLPCWAHLSDAEYRRQIQRMVRTIERDARTTRGGAPVLGLRRILALHPHHRPAELERSPAPLCHASTKQARDRYRAKYRDFVAAFRRAAEQLRSGVVTVQFPPFSFPPPAPFTCSSA